jgi:uncharacterized membrane protein YhaH (DUF805 family)
MKQASDYFYVAAVVLLLFSVIHMSILIIDGDVRSAEINLEGYAQTVYLLLFFHILAKYLFSKKKIPKENNS